MSRSSSVEVGRYLTFTLGREAYALDILDITEIIEFRAPTVVPMMPYFVRGVLNLRGRALPVIDLAARFGRGETTVARRTAIIVVSAGGSDLGFMVDGVNQVMELDPGSIEPAPAFGAGAPSAFIRGMAHHGEDFIIVLDIGGLLTGAELAQLSGPGGAGDTAGAGDAV